MSDENLAMAVFEIEPGMVYEIDRFSQKYKLEFLDWTFSAETAREWGLEINQYKQVLARFKERGRKEC